MTYEEIMALSPAERKKLIRERELRGRRIRVPMAENVVLEPCADPPGFCVVSGEC